MSTRRIHNNVFCVMVFFTICLCYFCTNAQANDETNTQILENKTSGQIEYFIYFIHSDKHHLTAKPIYLSNESDEYFIGLKILQELFKGPKDKNLSPAWPPGTSLRAFFIGQDAQAWVDVAIEGNSKGEVPFPKTDKPEGMLPVYSIVHSVCLNLQEVNKVKILINGSDIYSLDGNTCLKNFYTPNMALVK